MAIISDHQGVLDRCVTWAVGFCRRNSGQSSHRVNLHTPEIESGIVVKVQSKAGLPSGYSGGPLILNHADEEYVFAINCLGADSIAVGASLALYSFWPWLVNTLSERGGVLKPYRFRVITSFPIILIVISLLTWRKTTYIDWWIGFSSWVFVPYVLSVQAFFSIKIRRIWFKLLQYIAVFISCWFWLSFTMWIA